MRTDLTASGVPNARALIETAQAMVASGKGLLAMDESTGTCDKRFASAGIAQTVAMRRAWRELQLTAPGLAECISGVILHDQSLHQRTADGFVQVGLFAGAFGNPALPRWLGSRAMALFFTPKSENERYTRQIRNAAGIAVFVSAQSDRAHWVEAGRCYERFALQATTLCIRNAFLNQPVEVSAVRPQFAPSLGLRAGERPGPGGALRAGAGHADVDAAPGAGGVGLRTSS